MSALSVMMRFCSKEPCRYNPITARWFSVIEAPLFFIYCISRFAERELITDASFLCFSQSRLAKKGYIFPQESRRMSIRSPMEVVEVSNIGDTSTSVFHSVLKHTLTIVSFCGIILTQELVLLSMVVVAIQLYHRRTFSCFLFVTFVLYLDIQSMVCAAIVFLLA